METAVFFRLNSAVFGISRVLLMVGIRNGAV